MKMICSGCRRKLESVNRPHDLRDHLVEILAENAYQSEIIDTLMENDSIGPGKEYADKEDWIDSWLEGLINWFFFERKVK